MKTAECVSPKHPDKMCDQISDAILDAYLKEDPNSRVAIEVMGGHGKVVVMGEVTMNGEITPEALITIVERVTGKTCSHKEKDKDLSLFINIVKQSPDIANGVDTGGAGDQGIMVGYACRGNEALIPQESYLARDLCKFIYEKYPYDGKTQVTLDDDGNIITLVASFQNVSTGELQERVVDWANQNDHEEEFEVLCNPAGDWNQGGFDADTGLTGRKLAVDNYGPQIPIGGGAFSGKDSTKVDRSGAYMARKIAVDMLKADETAKEVIVKLAYAIGVAEPVMITATIDGMDINVVNAIVNPRGIIEFLDLKKPQFEETAKWGHFGNGFKWDK
jgi:S-adenosylmethionine synthetase